MFDVTALRSRYPAFSRVVDGRPAVYLDGPAGTQVPGSVIDTIRHALVTAVSNVGGGFGASQDSESVVEAARRAAADLVGGRPDEVVFGPNMTSLTFAFSRALSRDWGPGDRIVVTRLDHDANVTPWAMAAVERGAEVAFCDIVDDDVSVDLDHLASIIDRRTRLVAVTACSNAFGTRVDLARVAAMAHESGALCYADAVHLAPHARMEVAAMGIDALVCSAYKFFGPHVGALWLRRDLGESIEAYRVRPAPASMPGKFETGTPSFPLLAGFAAAVDYLASLGSGGDRPARLDSAYAAIAEHESRLGALLLANLPSGVRLWGKPTMEGRVPTFALEVSGRAPREVAAALSARGIFVWAGHHYAVEPMAALGFGESGLLRVGLVHTSTEEEIETLVVELGRVARPKEI